MPSQELAGPGHYANDNFGGTLKCHVFAAFAASSSSVPTGTPSSFFRFGSRLRTCTVMEACLSQLLLD